MAQHWDDYIAILKKEVQPALGCTEPTSIAYAAAHAARLLGTEFESLRVEVSDNLYKNAMGVFVPGTGKIGLPIAAAVGALGGNPDGGLEVLATVRNEHVKRAVELIEEGRVQIERADTAEFIFCRAIAQAHGDTVEVTIAGGHTDIVEEKKNGEVIFEKPRTIATDTEGNSSVQGNEITLKSIYDFALAVPFEKIAFMLEARDINMALADEGLAHQYGLELGRTIKEQIKAGILSKDLVNDMAAYASAASDARMGGATLPAMSNYGSGNQGITATIPVVKMAQFVKADEERLARALTLSHLAAIYIKSHYPSLSAFCGNTATSAAVSMALVYLNDGTYEQGCMAINNVISDTAGMVCDGAKSTCAMKVNTAAQAAYKSCFLALAGHGVTNQGIVADDVEKTIDSLGDMICKGMQQTDVKIIEIMRNN